MKFLVVLSVAVACVASAVVDESAAPVLKSEYDSSPEGAYQFAYETGNGIAAQVTGSLKSIPGENPAVAAVGAFRYTSPDGQPIELSYVADEKDSSLAVPTSGTTANP